MLPHEYSVIGVDRTAIGRYLGTTASLLTTMAVALITFCYGLLKRFEIFDADANLIVLPLGVAFFYFVIHMVFNKWIWRCKCAQALLGVPNLNGVWECYGSTIDKDGKTMHEWTAKVIISQTWEKICVYLEAGQSKSRSKSASLIKEPGRGYVLMYSYQNEPRIGEPELQTHVGYCELHLSEDLTTAEGDYFNNKGRITFGRMSLKRKGNING